jgi:protein-disulfide isomerase
MEIKKEIEALEKSTHKVEKEIKEESEALEKIKEETGALENKKEIEAFEKSTYILGLSLILASLVIAASVVYTGGIISGNIQKLNLSVIQLSNGTLNLPTQVQGEPQGQVLAGGINITGSASRGNDSAKVVVVEFSDFQCPYCGNAAKDAVAQIERDYVNTGKVKLVFKHFPLPFHQYAAKAAEAAECAKDQGKFWEMHDKLFSNQAALTVDDLKRYASDLGLNTAEFNQCLDSGAKIQFVHNDVNYGTQLGVTGTPTFYINGNQIVGAQPYATFKQAIDTALGAS